jgi:hypothetical protein
MALAASSQTEHGYTCVIACVTAPSTDMRRKHHQQIKERRKPNQLDRQSYGKPTRTESEGRD